MLTKENEARILTKLEWRHCRELLVIVCTYYKLVLESDSDRGGPKREGGERPLKI